MSRRSMTAVTQGSPPIEFPALAATGSTRREREEHDGDDGEHADADELRRAQAYDQY